MQSNNSSNYRFAYYIFAFVLFVVGCMALTNILFLTFVCPNQKPC